MIDGQSYLKNVTTLKHDPEKCTGCRRCVEVCPHNVYEMRDKKAYVINKDSCMECGACAKNCEAEAMTVTAGVGCAAAIIMSKIKGTEVTCGCSENSNSCC